MDINPSPPSSTPNLQNCSLRTDKRGNATITLNELYFFSPTSRNDIIRLTKLVYDVTNLIFDFAFIIEFLIRLPTLMKAEGFQSNQLFRIVAKFRRIKQDFVNVVIKSNKQGNKLLPLKGFSDDIKRALNHRRVSNNCTDLQFFRVERVQ